MISVEIKGCIRKGKKTKDLVKSLKAGDIALIDHQDIDEVSAESLSAAKVRAVINAKRSISGRYPNRGPMILSKSGIPIIDNVGEEIFDILEDGSIVTIKDGDIWLEGSLVARGRLLSEEEICLETEKSRDNIGEELERFIFNTLDYAKQETDLVLGELKLPEIRTKIERRPVLVVVRGSSFKEDLKAVESYICEERPVLIGVDGGADALVEMGILPDIIIGDMDSVSDSTLKCGAEIIVHAYCDGKAPGLERVRSLGLDAAVLPSKGTSEDVAMLLAYEKGADLIVAVGTHSNLVDFLEKGRKGMASTFLVRLKVGSILVDAKGLSRLYRGKLRFTYPLLVILGAFIPLLAVLSFSPVGRQILDLFLLRLKVMLGII